MSDDIDPVKLGCAVGCLVIIVFILLVSMGLLCLIWGMVFKLLF